MSIATIVIIFGLAALAVMFFLARRMLRLALRLALGLFLVLILIGGALYWWSQYGNSVEQNSNRPTAATPARRTTSNR